MYINVYAINLQCTILCVKLGPKKTDEQYIAISLKTSLYKKSDMSFSA